MHGSNRLNSGIFLHDGVKDFTELSVVENMRFADYLENYRRISAVDQNMIADSGQVPFWKSRRKNPVILRSVVQCKFQIAVFVHSVRSVMHLKAMRFIFINGFAL